MDASLRPIAAASGGLRDRLRYSCAALSAGAAALHLSVVPAHLDEHVALGLALVLAAWFQLGWAVLVGWRPTVFFYRAGIVGNLLIAGAWAASRTVGLPVGEETPYAVQVVDASTVIFEVLIVLGCLAALTPRLANRPTGTRTIRLGTLIVAVAVLPTTAFALVAAPLDRAGLGAASESHVAAGHGDGATAGAGDSTPATHTIKVGDDSFSPRKLEIEPGDTVRWVNKGDAPHTATADSGDFSSENLDPGQSYSFTFEDEGQYLYFCRYHGGPDGSGMAGVIIVSSDPDKKVPVRSAAAAGDVAAAPVPPSTHRVVIGDDTFAPSRLEITAGDSVAWVASGARLHTVTADSGVFASPDLDPGQNFAFRFSTPGIYFYYCKYHGGPGGSGMAGSIVVKAIGESGPPPVVKGPGSSSGGGGGHGSHKPGAFTVTLGDESFSPARLSVVVGDTVTWAGGTRSHTVTANSGAFDSGEVAPGEIFSFTFKKAGTYGYYCEFHGDPGSGMAGTIVVTSPSGGGGGGSGGDGDGQAGVDPDPTPSDPPAAAPVPPGSHKVTMGEKSFSPATLRIAVGDMVTWTGGTRYHTVTASGGAFDSGDLAAGENFSFTFTKAGTYGYYCRFHGDPGSGMAGTIVVTEGGSTGGGDAGGGDAGDGAGAGGDTGKGDTGSLTDPDPSDGPEVTEAKQRCREWLADAREDGRPGEIEEAEQRCREELAKAREDDAEDGWGG